MGNIQEYFNRQFQQLAFLNTAAKEELVKLTEKVEDNKNLFSSIKLSKVKYQDLVILRENAEIVQTKSSKVKETVLKKSDTFSKILANVEKRVTQLERKASKNTVTINGGKFVIGNLKGSLKMTLPKTKKISQSELDYSARSATNEIKLEQIRYMKDIIDLLKVRGKIDAEPVKPKKDKPEESSNPLDWFKKAVMGVAAGLIGPLLGASIFSKVGGVFSKAKGLIGKAGLGKILGWAGVATAAVGAVSTIKDAWADFQKYSAKGHVAAAQSSIIYGTMGVTGNLFNAIGSLAPFKAGLPLMALGSGLLWFADKFKQNAKDEDEGYIGQAETKTRQVTKLIEEKKAAGTFLEMRPNSKDPTDIFWEYRSGNKWLPIMDNATGSKLSMMRGRDKIIQSADGTGIQRYKLKTDSGFRDLEIDPSGKIVMRIPGVDKGVPVSSKESQPSPKPTTVTTTSPKSTKSAPLVDPKTQRDLNTVEKEVSVIDSFLGKISGVFKSTELTKMSGASFTQASEPTTNVPSGATSTIAGDFTATRGSLTLTRTEVQKKALQDTSNNELFLGATSPRITAPFYRWRSPDWYIARGMNAKNAHFHNGVDIGVPSGTKVRSVYPGIVKYSKLGVNVDTDKNIRINYWHIKPSVKVGDSVAVGQEIGTVFKDAHSTGPHLHFGVQSLEGLSQANKVDPTKYSIDPAAWLANKDAQAYTFDLLPYTSKTASFIPGSDKPREIAAYAKGTSYVPHDMVARVHKDEIILTKAQAQKIKAEAKSNKPQMSNFVATEEYNVFEDSDFWINTFMPALANVVKLEYEYE